MELSRKERALLNAFPESYRDALIYFHHAMSVQSSFEGRASWTLTELVQKMISDYLRELQPRDEDARVAFEILIAPDFIKSLKADYERMVSCGR